MMDYGFVDPENERMRCWDFFEGGCGRRHCGRCDCEGLGGWLTVPWHRD